jgi:hypothetical protein
LLEYDFQQMSLTRMYQAADVLYEHKQTIEKHLYETEKKLGIYTLYLSRHKDGLDFCSSDFFKL